MRSYSLHWNPLSKYMTVGWYENKRCWIESTENFFGAFKDIRQEKDESLKFVPAAPNFVCLQDTTNLPVDLCLFLEEFTQSSNKLAAESEQINVYVRSNFFWGSPEQSKIQNIDTANLWGWSEILQMLRRAMKYCPYTPIALIAWTI